MREKTDFLHVRLSHSEKTKLERLAANEGRTISNFIRNIIRKMEVRLDGEE